MVVSRRPSAPRALVARQVGVGVLPEPGRALHSEDDAQGGDGAPGERRPVAVPPLLPTTSLACFAHTTEHTLCLSLSLLRPAPAPQVLLRQALLSTYFKHVMQYKETLLTKFFGLHRVKPHGGRNVRFVVMGNLFCTTAKIDRRFDLKGSTYGRLTPPGYNPETKILKDLDIDYRLQLEEGCYEKLMHQIKVDCQLLEKCNIMDYSLLLGVSFRSKASSNELAAMGAAQGGGGARKKPGAGGAGGNKTVGFDAPAAEPLDPEMDRLAKEVSEKLPKAGGGGRVLDRTLSSVLKAKSGGGRMQVVSGDLSDGQKTAEEDDDEEEDFPDQSARDMSAPALASPISAAVFRITLLSNLLSAGVVL